MPGPFNAFRIIPALVAAFAGALTASTTVALEPEPNEAAILKTCEERICLMAIGKKPEGDDLACGLTKTWAKDKIKNGGSGGVSWGFGDAQCKVNVAVRRSDIVSALTKPAHTINIPEHTVKCLVERDNDAKPVTAKLAPKLVFKNGKADKVWINLKDVDGPSAIKATIWTAANLEDKLGLFHKGMIKSINKFLLTQCPKNFGPNAKHEPKKSRDRKAEKSASAARPATADATATKPAKPTPATPPKAP